MEIDGPDHLPLIGDMTSIAEEVEEFLTASRRMPEPNRVLATVLFTDIVGSPERRPPAATALGASLRSRHDAAVRTELERFGGREVTRTADGFLATFDGPARAIRCAIAIREAAQRLGLRIRAGLHTGEIEQHDRHVSGIAAQIAMQISALGGPG